MKELRIGLVLYGGVSLAVYMSGIITEIYHLLRATRAPGEEAADSAEGGTPACYRALIEELRARHGGPALRVVVDAVAGSSAGGLGGAALAKAVVDGADPTVLNRTWVEEADIAKLKGAPARPPLKIYALLGVVGVVVLASAAWRRVRAAGKRAIRVLARLFGRREPETGQPRAGTERTLAGTLRAIRSLPGIDLGWLCRTAYTALTTTDGRTTPLDGGHFTRMIARSFRDMSRHRGPPLLPEDGTFELCLTSTDLYGWPRHLPVSPKLHARTLYESTHAHALEFRFRPYDPRPHALDDLALTFACRGTAGFPGAFAPVGYDDIAADYRAARPGEDPPPHDVFAEHHLREHRLAGFPARSAWMVDGGVLDNKPFSYVAGAIEDKPAGHQVHRGVIYIEPDPDPAPSEREAPDTVLPVPPSEPPAPRHLVGPMFSLIRHEPILADLGALDRRNAKVRWLRRIRDAARDSALERVRALAADKGLSWPPRTGELSRLRRLTNAAAARHEEAGYPGYVLLKTRRAADELARLICRAHGYPYASRQGYLVRRLVRLCLVSRGALDAETLDDDTRGALDAETRDGAHAGPRRRRSRGPRFRLSPPERELLGAFDLAFRLRRLRALVQEINRAYGALPDDPGRATTERGRVDAAKAALSGIAFGLESAVHDESVLARARDALDGLDIDTMVQEPGFDAPDVIARTAVAHRARFDVVYDDLATEFRKAGRARNREIARALAKLPEGPRGDAARAFGAFPFVDLALFPLMDMAGIGDLLTIDTMRISPADARCLSDDPKRLKGWRHGAFAGFLDRGHRQRDLLWGRLDGAERLIELLVAAVVPGKDRDKTTDELRCAHTARILHTILDEAPTDEPGIAELVGDLRARLDGTAPAAAQS